MYGGVHPVKNLDDARYWLDLLATSDAGTTRRGVVVGGGYIGVEMAEALALRGFSTTLLTRRRVMSTLDPVMSTRIESALEHSGITVPTATTVAELDAPGGRVSVVITDNGHILPVDVVVLGVGGATRHRSWSRRWPGDR